MTGNPTMFGNEASPSWILFGFDVEDQGVDKAAVLFAQYPYDFEITDNSLHPPFVSRYGDDPDAIRIERYDPLDHRSWKLITKLKQYSVVLADTDAEALEKLKNLGGNPFASPEPDGVPDPDRLSTILEANITVEGSLRHIQRTIDARLNLDQHSDDFIEELCDVVKDLQELEQKTRVEANVYRENAQKFEKAYRELKDQLNDTVPF